MKGTIDQVDAFFSGVTAAWAKALLILGSIWIGHFVGLLTDSLSWGEDGLECALSPLDVAAIPLTCISTFASCFHWPLFGIVILLVFCGGFLGIYYSDTARLPLFVGLMTAQAWATYMVYRHIVGHYGSYFGFVRFDSLIGPILMVLLTLAAVSVAIVAWRKER